MNDIVRKTQDETLVCLFNFSAQEQEVWLDAIEGAFTDLISEKRIRCAHCILSPYQYNCCLQPNQ